MNAHATLALERHLRKSKILERILANAGQRDRKQKYQQKRTYTANAAYLQKILVCSLSVQKN